MKTINVTDDMYDFLSSLSKEIKTQNTRATRPPYFFQVQEDQEVSAPDGCGEEVWVMDGEICLRTPEDIKIAYFEYKGWEIGNKEDEENYKKLYSWDIDEALEVNYRKVNIEIKPKFSNSFLTEKACLEHIAFNRNNLTNPKPYLHAASRNREMDMLFKFITESFND